MGLPFNEAMAVLAREQGFSLSHDVRKLLHRSLELLDEQTGKKARTKTGRNSKPTATVRCRLRCRRRS